MMRSLIVLALLSSCSRSADKKEAPEQKPGASAPAAGPQPASDKSAAASATPQAVDPQLVRFCAQAYFKMMDCFKDDEFWQVFSTMYFANSKLAVDEDERKQWIGILKEDLLKLHGERAFEKNCEASLQHNKAPSERSIKMVNEARQKSCAEFGSAFGYMVFNEGAFHQPK
jgi:hypothetical protein